MKTNSLDFDAQALREKILDLAMRGKLVKQDPNDEPASLLLEKIKAEKEELVREKKIKKRELNLPKFDKPSDLPAGWVITKLKEITTPLSLNDGDWILSKNMSDKSEIKLIQLGSIGYGKYINKGFKYITNDTFDELNCTQIKPGYLLINRLINKNRLMTTILPDIDGKLITAVDICWIAPSEEFDQEFMMYQLMSPEFQKRVNKLASGSTRKRISKGNLINIPICLPPLEEQSRIAAKIAQLFALLRKVESSTQQYAKLQTLLKSKVLALAMRGKLVEQDPNDEPASVLLEKIKAEKQRLIKEKKIKKSKPLPLITDDEKPFDIPDSWEWVRLGDVAQIEMGQAPKSSTVNQTGNGIEFHQGKTEFSDEIIKKSNKFTTLDNKVVDESYILMAVRAPVGDVNLLDRNIYIGRGLAGIKGYKINKNYLFRYLMSDKAYYEAHSSGSTFKAINGNTIKGTPVPLPPLSEQSRIAAKIAQLFALLRKVESSI